MTARGEHVSGETLARLAQHDWPGGDRERVEMHLADCALCRRRLIEQRDDSRKLAAAPVPPAVLRQVEDLVPRRRRQAPRRHLALAAAAALLLISVTVTVLQRSGGAGPSPSPAPAMRGDLERDWSPERPEHGERLAAAGDALRFRWPALDGAVSYRLVVLDRDGGRLVELETEATGAAVAWASIGAGERSYFVEASLDGGDGPRSRVVDFTVMQ